MDDDDDAWSYSYPPSTDLLPLQTTGSCDDGAFNDSLRGSHEGSSLRSPARLSSDLLKPPKLDNATFRSISSSLPGPSALSLGNKSSGGFMPKAVPADPHTTKRDASSIMSKEGSTNALASNGKDGSASPPSTPKTDLSNSIRIWQKQQEQDSQNTQLSEMAAAAAAEENNDVAVSPKIIAYRKTHKKTWSEGNGPAFLEQQNELEEEKFDRKLYVAEKFKGTQYRYATMRRNVDFHTLFRSIDLTDRLLDDFACALSREILLQGRLYVTERFICFNSNLLGWVTSLTVPFEDIKRIDKKSTAGLFPNGISIETKDAKHSFASFLSRDSVYEFLRTVWQASTGKPLSELNSSPPLPLSLTKSRPSSSAEGNISSYINSIDGDDGPDVKITGPVLPGEQTSTEEESTDESDYSNSDAELESPQTEASPVSKSLQDPAIVLTQIRRLKPESMYKNMGPETHIPTRVSKSFEDDDKMNEIMTATISAPMGTVFDILFGGENTSFHSHFLETHNASELSPYNDYHPMEEDPTRLERKYTYKRALGYSIGPKSTNCVVSEIIEHLNFADYVVLLSITSTPDVPSGGAFTVRTRYYFTWGEANTTTIKIAYFVKWTGSSWIKKMVENLTQTAQAEAAKDLIESLNKEIADHTFPASGPPALKADFEAAKAEQEEIPSSKTEKQKKRKEKATAGIFSSQSTIGAICILGSLFMSLLLAIQVRMMAEMLENKTLMQKQLAITTTLLGVLQLQNKKEAPNSSSDDIFWANVDAQEGRTLSKNERASYLVKQALLLLEDDDKNSVSQSLMGLL